jgi:hypothetical protein
VRSFVVRAPVLALVVLLAFASAFAQKTAKAPSTDDNSITDPALLQYVEANPLEHGSFHGYEDGFQAGDTDYHLQRPEPDFRKVKEYRLGTRGYDEGGNKEQYRTGYQNAYILGYHDAVAGKPFAGFDRLEAAATNRTIEVAADDAAASDDMADQLELAALKEPIHVPFAAVFPKELTVEPPGPSRETILARIMNNLRRTFMPGVVTTPNAAAAVPAAAFTGQGGEQANRQ